MADSRWRCIWCGEVTLSVVNARLARRSRCHSEAELRALHSRYAEGEPVGDLARIARTPRDSLLRYWWGLGLPTRSVASANALCAPRKRKSRALGAQNPAYRCDLADDAIIAAYAATRSMARTALALGCSLSTVSRRIARVSS